MRVFCVLMTLLVGCAVSPHPPAAGWTAWKEGGVSLAYPKNGYTRAKLTVLPKVVQVANGWPGQVGPKRWLVDLSHPPRTTMVPEGARYYYPATSHIYITPLQDASVLDVAAAYPNLATAAKNLQILLADPDRDFTSWISPKWNAPRPAGMPPLPQEPWLNAGLFLKAHFRRVETASLRGYRLLGYSRQGNAGYGVTNSELTYNFQGLTKDGKYYVSAQLSVRHPELPESMDDPRAASDETESTQQAEQLRVNALDEAAFEPPLKDLDEMLTSIRVR